MKYRPDLKTLQVHQPKYTFKSLEMESRERHRAFWRNESLGAPLIFAASVNPDYSPDPWSTSAPRKDWDLMPAWHLNMVKNYLEGTLFHADAMPIASLMVGLDITNAAVLAGGDYDYCSEVDFIDFRPGRFNIHEPIPTFDPDHDLVTGLRNCYEAVIDHVRQKAAVNTPMTLDPLSSLYSLSPSESFLLDMINHPDRIKKRTTELTTVYLQFYDYFYEFLLDRGYGESSSWFQVWAEGKFESVRCDFSTMFSEPMFRDFVLPELDRICDHMDYSLFNMCSIKHARFIDALAEVSSLNGIFWNPEPYLNGVLNHMDTLRRIKELGLCLEIVCQTVEEAVWAYRELGPDGLYLFLEPKFAGPSRAEEAIERIHARRL